MGASRQVPGWQKGDHGAGDWALLKAEFPTENSKLFTPKLALEVIHPTLNSPAPAGA